MSQNAENGISESSDFQHFPGEYALGSPNYIHIQIRHFFPHEASLESGYNSLTKQFLEKKNGDGDSYIRGVCTPRMKKVSNICNCCCRDTALWYALYGVGCLAT